MKVDKKAARPPGEARSLQPCISIQLNVNYRADEWYLFNRKIIRSICFAAETALFGLDTFFEATRSTASSAPFAVGAPGSVVSSDMMFDLRHGGLGIGSVVRSCGVEG